MILQVYGFGVRPLCPTLSPAEVCGRLTSCELCDVERSACEWCSGGGGGGGGSGKNSGSASAGQCQLRNMSQPVGSLSWCDETRQCPPEPSRPPDVAVAAVLLTVLLAILSISFAVVRIKKGRHGVAASRRKSHESGENKNKEEKRSGAHAANKANEAAVGAAGGGGSGGEGNGVAMVEWDYFNKKSTPTTAAQTVL